MVIAIDETGTFNYVKDAKLRHAFVAAFLLTDNNAIEIKKEQFEKWEQRIGSDKRDKHGEIKGSLLAVHDLINFVFEVVLKSPRIKFSCNSVIPEKIGNDLINKHKDFEVLLINQTLKSNVAFSKKEANFITNLGAWLNKRNENEFTKVLCLRHCLMDSLRHAFVYSIAANQEMEFLNLQFKVDADFINNENIYWKEYALKTIEEYSRSKPFPLLDTWTSEHPIVKKYVINGKGINLRLAFEDQLSFMNSKENFEIRIVDIIGTIVNRYFNNNSDRISKAFSLLEKVAVVKDYHTELRLNDFDENKKFFEFTGREVIQ